MRGDEALYLLARRLNVVQVCAAGCPEACDCAGRAPIVRNNRHLEDCPKGGRSAVHDAGRNTLRAMARAAGFEARTEEPGLVDNTAQRPGDAYIDDWDGQFGDLAIDLTVVSSQTTDPGEHRRRRQKVGRAARVAERTKELGRVTDSDELIADHLRRKGVTFMPIGMETTGATTPTWSTFIQQLSENAHERRGHDPIMFRRLWTVEMAMTLARRGARAGIRRARALAAACNGGRSGAGDGELGELGPLDVEMPVLTGDDGRGDGAPMAVGGG